MQKESQKTNVKDEAGNRDNSANGGHMVAELMNPATPADNVLIQKSSGNTVSDEHGECIAAGQINYLTEGMSDLRQRIAKLEATVLSIENHAATSGTRDLPKDTMHQITNIARQIEVINEGLRTTPGYNLGKTFTCASCNSNGAIAIKVRCTSCGKENWWGYWPKKNNAEK